MPRLDGTGPRGSGRPGRGMGPCHTAKQQENYGPRMHRHGHRHGNGSGCNQLQNNQDVIYDYSAEELNNRKQTLEKEMQWLNERIKEIGETNEDSNTSN